MHDAVWIEEFAGPDELRRRRGDLQNARLSQLNLCEAGEAAGLGPFRLSYIWSTSGL
jgi:hypothetical protein